MAKTDSRRVRPLIATFLIATLASAFVSWKFILLPPVIFSAVVALVFAIAFFTASGQPQVE